MNLFDSNQSQAYQLYPQVELVCFPFNIKTPHPAVADPGNRQCVVRSEPLSQHRMNHHEDKPGHGTNLHRTINTSLLWGGDYLYAISGTVHFFR